MVVIVAQNQRDRPVMKSDIERALIVLENYKRILSSTERDIKHLNSKYGLNCTINNIGELVDANIIKSDDEIVQRILLNKKYLDIVHKALNDIRQLKNVGRSRRTQIAIHLGDIYYHILYYSYISSCSPLNGTKMIESIQKNIGINMAPTTYLKCRRGAIEQFAKQISIYKAE